MVDADSATRGHGHGRRCTGGRGRCGGRRGRGRRRRHERGRGRGSRAVLVVVPRGPDEEHDDQQTDDQSDDEVDEQLLVHHDLLSEIVVVERDGLSRLRAYPFHRSHPSDNIYNRSHTNAADCKVDFEGFIPQDPAECC